MMTVTKRMPTQEEGNTGLAWIENVEISDSPGVLAKITRIIGDKGGNIVEITHQRLFYDVPVKLAEIDAVVETRNRSHVGEIVAALDAAGFRTRLLSSTAVE